MSVLANNTHANISTPLYVKALELSSVQGVVGPLIINNGSTIVQITQDQPIPGISSLSSNVYNLSGVSVHSSYAVINSKDLQVLQPSDPSNTLTFRHLSTGTTNITPSGGGLIAMARPGGQGMEFNSTLYVGPIQTSGIVTGPPNAITVFAPNLGPYDQITNSGITLGTGYTPSDWMGTLTTNITGSNLQMNRTPGQIPPITIVNDTANIINISSAVIGTATVSSVSTNYHFISTNNISSLSTSLLNVNNLTELGSGIVASSFTATGAIYNTQNATVNKLLYQDIRQTLLPPPPFVPRSTTGAIKLGPNPGTTYIENKFNDKLGIADYSYGRYYNSGYVYSRISTINTPGAVNFSGWAFKTGRLAFQSNPGSTFGLVQVYKPCIIMFLITQQYFDTASCFRSEIFSVYYGWGNGFPALYAISWNPNLGDGTFNIPVANQGQQYPLQFNCQNVSQYNGPSAIASWTVFDAYDNNPLQPPL